MRPLLARVAFGAIVTLLSSLVAQAQVRDSAAVAATVQRLEGEWVIAAAAHDSAKLLNILSPQYALISPGGVTLQASTAPAQMTVRVLARRPPWHSWPDVAIASFTAGSRYFVTDVWRLDGNRWRVVARYVSGVSP